MSTSPADFDTRCVLSPARNGLWCECTLTQLDGRKEWLLDGYRAPTPRLALRWLQQQATRLADLIDPNPDVRWAPANMLRPVDDVLDFPTTPDPATTLRRWPDDIGEHDQALQAMREGEIYRFIAEDRELRYDLSTRPLLVSTSPYLTASAHSTRARLAAPHEQLGPR